MTQPTLDTTKVSALVRAALQGRGLAFGLDEAKRLADLAEGQGTAMGLPVVVAVTDPEGMPILLHRMEGSLPASVELAMNKAFTAAAFRMPTHTLATLAVPGGMLQGVETTHGGRVVIFGGGFPVVRDGVRLGALGVSGGTVEQDMAIAQAALDSFLVK